MKRQKLGRPRKPADEKRSHRIEVRTTEAQGVAIRKAAARLGLDIGPWLVSLGMRAVDDDTGRP